MLATTILLWQKFPVPDCQFSSGYSCCPRPWSWCCRDDRWALPQCLVCDWKLQENFMHTPLLSPIDSATSHYCQSGRHCLHGRSCAAGDCQGSGVHRAASCQPQGAPLKRPPGQNATTKTRTFAFATHNAHGWETQRGETSGAALCRQKEQLRPLQQTSHTGLSARKAMVLLQTWRPC